MSVEGITYVRAFYTGMPSTSPGSLLRYEVRDVPCAGESGALVLAPNDQGRRRKTEMLTLFSPFTLQADQITSRAGEISEVKEIRTETRIEGVKVPKVDVKPTVVRRPEEELTDERIDGLTKIITNNWKMRCRLGLPFDMAVAALVLTRFGRPVPEERPAVKTDASGEVKKSGKEPAPELLKPVSLESKPGQVMKYFMDERRSLTEAMAQFGSTRSSLQSSLYQLNALCGVGYVIAADIVTIVLPPGCQDPFKMEVRRGNTVVTVEAEKKVRGKPLLKELVPLPDKGKRREVAVASCVDWIEVSAVAGKVGCSENSVRSHLNDLHLKHGFGFEIDGGRCRLIVPEGWMP